VCRLRVRSWHAATGQIARQARSWARSTLKTWAVHDGNDEIAVILTELVTNSVRYAGVPVDVTLALTGGFVDLTVADHATALAPASRRIRHARRGRRSRGPGGALPSGAVPLSAGRGPSPLSVVFSDAPRAVGIVDALVEQPVEGVAENGRGLFLVDAFAESWAITPTSQGSRAWARREVDPEWPYRQACTCCPDNPSAIPRASGHVVVPMPLA
jgi:Histidine kinase-like ATPase domain